MALFWREQELLYQARSEMQYWSLFTRDTMVSPNASYMQKKQCTGQELMTNWRNLSSTVHCFYSIPNLNASNLCICHWNRRYLSIHGQKWATVIFHSEEESYLLLVDYTRWFLIVWNLNSMTFQHVINHFKLIFSEYGWPDTLVSDNGPCYA